MESSDIRIFTDAQYKTRIEVSDDISVIVMFFGVKEVPFTF
jgi:hypothetical protein